MDVVQVYGSRERALRKKVSKFRRKNKEKIVGKNVVIVDVKRVM